MRRWAGNHSVRLLGVVVVVVLVSVGCRSSKESATTATAREAGNSPSESLPAGTDAAKAIHSPAGTDHSALTVVVDPDPEPEPASTAPPNGSTTTDSAQAITDSTTTAATEGGDTSGASDRPTRFATLGPGAELPTGSQCAAWVRSAGADTEHRPDNTGANTTVPAASVTAGLVIDGADATRNGRLAPRVDGDFTGTTEQILRWGACKWGFDEDITRARAVAESSWRMSTTGDRTDDGALCRRIGLSAPCPQSYGLLQVKGTVHEGTYPTSAQATAFGVDYAMAWLRACFEGGFNWLGGTGTGPGYGAGDEWGCVGAWFSGQWWDQEADNYVAKVRQHLDQRTWESYR